jgi:hypothetical protein
MFEGANEKLPITKFEAVQIVKDSGIKIFHNCCCCGKRLSTFWDRYNELDGAWMALETRFSDVFDYNVVYPDRVLCQYCFGTGLWKKKGIRWK